MTCQRGQLQQEWEHLRSNPVEADSVPTRQPSQVTLAVGTEPSGDGGDVLHL